MNLSLKKNFADTICLTVDVEWANSDVLADTVRLLDERGLRGTFFCTHAGIETTGHERAIHPNFRHKGDSFQQLRRKIGNELYDWADSSIYEFTLNTIQTLYPNALGVRAHNLFYDSELFHIYKKAGLEYDSTYFLPMAQNIMPVLKEYNILEIPVYYMDHVDIMNQISGFTIEGLGLENHGIKVFDFHPNMIFLNTATEEQYVKSKSHYHDYEKLLKLRYSERGVRTLFIDLLDFICKKKLQVLTLSEVNTIWRRARAI